MNQIKTGESSQLYAPAPVIVQASIETIQGSKPEEFIVDKRRHFLAAFFLSFMFGIFGVDRFYLGKYGTGLLKLVSFGGFGFWALMDLILISSGSMKDIDGNELIDAKRYKRFAHNFLWIFSAVVLMIFTSFIALMIFVVTQFMNSIGTDGLLNLLPGVSGLNIDNSSIDSAQVLDQFKSMYNGK